MLIPASNISAKNLVFLALIFFLAPAHVWAAAVTNLTDASQTIEIQGEDGLTAMQIEAGRTWRIQSKMEVRYKGREYFIGEHEEFAIWNDGSFGPQRANSRAGRMF